MSTDAVAPPEPSNLRTVEAKKQFTFCSGLVSERLPSLDGFRALSIIMVLAGHSAFSLRTPHGFFLGDLGVRCFFVISGFIITYLLLREENEIGRISLPLFYGRRFLRIVPVYLLYLACLAMLDLTTALRLSACNFITALTYTKDFGCGQWVDGHLWSLSVEEQFYLLWPTVLLYGNRKSRVPIAVALICLCPIIRLAYHLGGLEAFASPFTNADALMFGCVGALLMNQNRPAVLAILEAHKVAGRLGALFLIVLPLFVETHFWLGFLTVPFASTLEGLGFAYLILSYTFSVSGFGYWFLNLAPMRFIGIISYSLYIWQEPFFSHPEEYGVASSPLLTFPINVFAAFIVAIISYYAFERPLFSLRRRLRPASGGDATIQASSV